MADGTAWRLVSQCATVEDLVRVFRTLASADGLTGIPVSGIGPGGRSQVRLVLALSSKAAVLDGDAVMTRDAGTVSVRFVKIDARGKGLLAHMVEHRDAESPPAVPRHLIPLGAAAGTPATARGDAKLAKCVFEPMGVVGGAAARVASAAAAAVPEVASTVRMPGAREAAPPTIRESGPPSAMASAAPGTTERPKREVQKTLMGMPALGRSKTASAPPPVGPSAAAAAPVMAPHTSSGATTTPVVATGTPPIGLDQSRPVPKGGVELKETGPTKPTRGAGVASPAMAAAAQAIAATPAAAFDNVATVPTAQGAVRRVEAAPSGPVEDVPTIPNEDIVTDVSVSLPDLPSGDYVDPIIEPPAPPMVHSPVPAPPPAAVYAVAGSSPGWQPPPMQAVPVVPGSGPYGAPPQPYYPTPYPGVAPMMIERDEDMTEMVQLQRVGGRSRWPVIAVTSGVIVIGVAVMVVVAARSGGEKHGRASLPPPAAKAGSAAASAAAGVPAAAAGAAEASAVETAPPPGEKCKVSFTSSPDATEVVLGGNVIGTTPFDYEGSCAAYQVTFRREKYQSQTKEIAAGTTTFDVRLERPEFRVKVTSRPPGATVKVGGEAVGKTPVTIALPGFETTSIELVKGGVTTTHRVYAGKTGQKVDVKLKSRR